METNQLILGIDLGGTDTKMMLFDACSGQEVARQSMPTQQSSGPDGKPDWFHNIRQAIPALEEETGQSIYEIGLCAPGFAAPDESCIVHMPGRLEALGGFNWTAELERERPVKVLNDAQAALLGEIWQGAAAGLQNVFMLTLGTGVGGAVMTDGRLLKGHLGRAGHLGHVSVNYRGPLDICNTPGSIELAIGNATLQDRCSSAYDNTHALVQAVEAGDDNARDIWIDSLKALAAHIASLINVLDPEAVVIGGGIAVAGDTLFKPLEELMEQFEWQPMGSRVKLLPAELGGWAGAFGAAYNMLRKDNQHGTG